MKALFLDGSRNNNFDTIHSLIKEELEKNGFEVDSILVRDVNVALLEKICLIFLKLFRKIHIF